MTTTNQITVYYGADTRRIYVRVPVMNSDGTMGWIDHGIDHASALRMRDELNDALLHRVEKMVTFCRDVEIDFETRAIYRDIVAGTKLWVKSRKKYARCSCHGFGLTESKLRELMEDVRAVHSPGPSPGEEGLMTGGGAVHPAEVDAVNNRTLPYAPFDVEMEGL